MKKLTIITLLFCMLLLTACGKDTEKVLAFQNELNAVIFEIETIHNEINAIDTSAENASEVMLYKLSDLNNAFGKLADIKIGDEDHAYISDLASEGAEYMNQAYDLFVEAYGGEEFDENTADLAYKYLERASKRVRVIVTMLHGKIPDGVVVH